MPSYTEQMERLKRCYGRLSQIDTGRRHDMHSENYRDELYTFFLNCYHLKDWLKNDNTFQVNGNVVEGYINNNDDLKLCADICNGIKHFTLNNPRSTESPSVGGQKISLKLGSGEPEISIKFIIDTTSGPRDGFELATNCLDLWQNFLLQHIECA
jgi:hypothetical protein